MENKILLLLQQRDEKIEPYKDLIAEYQKLIYKVMSLKNLFEYKILLDQKNDDILKLTDDLFTNNIELNCLQDKLLEKDDKIKRLEVGWLA